MNGPCRPTRLTCEGLRAGALMLPPFEVRAGELVKLQFPRSTPDTARARREVLGQLCAAADACGPVRACGVVAALETPRTRSAVRELFHRQRAVEWFCRQTGLSRAVALPSLKRIDLPPDVPVSSLAGTPRRLLALQAVLARGADVVVFDTAGLDPLGIQTLLQAVSERLGESAALYLSCESEWEPPGVSFAAVIPLVPHQTEPAFPSLHENPLSTR